MAVLGVPRPSSFCSQGEKLCEITLALTPLKKFTNLTVIFGRREFTQALPHNVGEDSSSTYMWGRQKVHPPSHQVERI